jgi:hypothetical protein
MRGVRDGLQASGYGLQVERESLKPVAWSLEPEAARTLS